MTDWYYHRPGQDRAGPLSADEMRAHYRDRRIVADTLAWHEGMREWQPLERLTEELGLAGVQPDRSLPPPPPPPPRPAATYHAAKAKKQAASPPSNRRGGIIAAMLVAALFVFAFVAALALPAYKRYVERTKAVQIAQAPHGKFDAERMAQTDMLARELVAKAMQTYYVAKSACPDNFEFESLELREPRYQGNAEDGWFGIAQAAPSGATCAYDVRFYGLGPEVLDKTVHYEVSFANGVVAIGCRNIDLPAGHAPAGCGA